MSKENIYKEKYTQKYPTLNNGPENVFVLDKVTLDDKGRRDESLPIMSISKTFCGALSVLLAIDGNFGENGIDATLEESLKTAHDKYPDRSGNIKTLLQLLSAKQCTDIKISELLNHTSGLKDLTFSDKLGSYSGRTTQEFFRDKLQRDLSKKGQHIYCNDGYGLMEEIINASSPSGDFKKEIYDRIINKLELNNTKFLEDCSDEVKDKVGKRVLFENEKLPNGEVIDQQKMISPLQVHPLGKVYNASAGLASSVADLKKFLTELIKLSTGNSSTLTDNNPCPKAVKMYWDNLAEINENASYGIGIVVEQTQDGIKFGNSGRFPANRAFNFAVIPRSLEDFKSGKVNLEGADLKFDISIEQTEDISFCLQNKIRNVGQNTCKTAFDNDFNNFIQDYIEKDGLINQDRLRNEFKTQRQIDDKVFEITTTAKDKLSKQLENEKIAKENSWANIVIEQRAKKNGNGIEK